MADISTLVADVEKLITEGSQELSDESYEEFGRAMATMMKRRLTEATERNNREFTLRMSNMGSPCARKLYLQKEQPVEERQSLPPATAMKFLFGDILEEVLLFLAKSSGHTVEGEQDEQEIAGIKGHRDAVIDGVLVDVKSASSYSFKKFKEGKLENDDPFGYVVQGNSYLYAGQDDPIITNKDQFGFFVIDKQLGHICLDMHDKKPWDLETAYENRKEIINGEELPERSFDSVPDGKSGNEKLDTFCSYCEVKDRCWPELRTFIYSTGPRYLTNVERVPKAPELLANGELVKDGEVITAD